MNKSKLRDLVYHTACGAAGLKIPDGPLDDDGFYGLVNEMGIKAFAQWIETLRHLHTDGEMGAYVFGVGKLEFFETIPDAVEHIWEHNFVLKPWRKDESK